MSTQNITEDKPRPSIEPLLSRTAAAAVLGTSDDALIEEIRSGALKGVLIGRRIKFRPSDLEAYIRRCEIVPEQS